MGAVVWHVTPPRDRASIRRAGLLPEGGSPSPYVWLFAGLADALRMRRLLWSGTRDNDLWAVDARGLELLPDPHPGWPGVRSLVSAAGIEPPRLRLLVPGGADR